MSQTGSPVRYFVVCAALLGLSVSSTQTAPPMAPAMPTFTAATNYPLGNVPPLVPGFMALGDLNGDGYTDAVTSDGDQPSRLRLLFNDGAGGFGGVTVVGISGPCPSAVTCATNVYRVEIADCVPNRLQPNGATFNDLIGQAFTAAGGNHGAWVSAVSALSNGWKSAGLISGQEHGKIVSCVAKQNGKGGR